EYFSPDLALETADSLYSPRVFKVKSGGDCPVLNSD
ncbi:MAG: hypothetical protein ACI85O_003943, partial [Saprospiraceae bacterium]